MLSYSYEKWDSYMLKEKNKKSRMFYNYEFMHSTKYCEYYVILFVLVSENVYYVLETTYTYFFQEYYSRFL